MTNPRVNKESHVQEKGKLSLFIVMGVSGSGKSIVGQALAKQLHNDKEFIFIDADDFHSIEAEQHMAANLPLNDAMRKPWIAAISTKLKQLNNQNINVVLAYSGLKQHHRNCFRELEFDCHFFYLSADIELIRTRMKQRENHFFSSQLLASQFEAMEAIASDEQDITKIDVSTSLENINKTILTLAQQALTKDFQ